MDKLIKEMAEVEKKNFIIVVSSSGTAADVEMQKKIIEYGITLLIKPKGASNEK